ncbi:MAG: HAH_0734 family protein [Haloarculaceae archaeon]
MKKLIIHGDPGIRKGAVIEYDGDQYQVFSVSRQGDWHGPDRPQLWCTIGTEDERDTYQRREYIAMHLDTENVDAEAVEVIKEKAGA